MEINTKLKINNLFLDLHENAILVYPESADLLLKSRYSYLRTRPDGHAFLVRKTNELEYTEDEYQQIFYEEARKLFNKVQAMNTYTFYIVDIFSYLGEGNMSNIVGPKLNTIFNQLPNLVLTTELGIFYNPEKQYWGFEDIYGRYSIFNKDDVIVPFETEFAKRYFNVDAKDKMAAIQKIKEGKGHVIN